MSKINFSKVEHSFDKALQQLFIDNLSELATMADAIQDPQKIISNQVIEEVIDRFKKELNKIKKQDPVLFGKLELSIETEEGFNRPASEYTHEDWIHLKALKLRIEELKKELHGQEGNDTKSDGIVEKERKRHINKRFNVRDDWLPLH